MYTRRELGKLALAALPAATCCRSNAFAQAKPNSKVRGVMIGMNVPYNFGGRSAPVDEIIEKCVQLGVSGVELRTQPVEAFLGLPDSLVTAQRRRPAAATPSRRRPSRTPRARPPPTRSASGGSAAPMDKVKDAAHRSSTMPASSIEIVKVDNILSMPDESSTTSSRWPRRSGRGRFPPRSPTSIRRRQSTGPCRKSASARSPTSTS